MIAGSIFRVRISQETFNSEVTAFDPDGLCGLELVEDDGTAICGGCDDLWTVGSGTWACIWFEGTVEELVESLEILPGKENLIHVELVEVDKRVDFCSRGRIVKLLALLDTQRSKKLLDCGIVKTELQSV